MTKLTFVLGGARSGKSKYAEALAGNHRGRKTYIATAEAFDAELASRIALHRQRRGEGWETCEAPLDLTEALAACKTGFILVDCVTVWIGNLLHYGRDVEPEVARLCNALASAKARIVIVSNEVGLGVVPDNALARKFRDTHGLANQQIAAVADEVVLISAGLPMILKRAQNRRGPGSKARSWRGHKA